MTLEQLIQAAVEKGLYTKLLEVDYKGARWWWADLYKEGARYHGYGLTAALAMTNALQADPSGGKIPHFYHPVEQLAVTPVPRRV